MFGDDDSQKKVYFKLICPDGKKKTLSAYDFLGISPKATPAEINRAYRNKARIHHPDKGGRLENFKTLKNIHEVLKDPETKKKYDRSLKAAEQAFGEKIAKFVDKNNSLRGFEQINKKLRKALESDNYREITKILECISKQKFIMATLKWQNHHWNFIRSREVIDLDTAKCALKHASYDIVVEVLKRCTETAIKGLPRFVRFMPIANPPRQEYSGKKTLHKDEIIPALKNDEFSIHVKRFVWKKCVKEQDRYELRIEVLSKIHENEENEQEILKPLLPIIFGSVEINDYKPMEYYKFAIMFGQPQVMHLLYENNKESQFFREYLKEFPNILIQALYNDFTFKKPHPKDLAKTMDMLRKHGVFTKKLKQGEHPAISFLTQKMFSKQDARFMKIYVDKLIEYYGRDILISRDGPKTVMHLAIERNYTKFLETFAKQYYIALKQSQNPPIPETKPSYLPLLFHVLKYVKKDETAKQTIEVLLKAGASLDYKHPEHGTMADYAIKLKRNKLKLFLVKKGSAVTEPDADEAVEGEQKSSSSTYSEPVSRLKEKEEYKRLGSFRKLQSGGLFSTTNTGPIPLKDTLEKITQAISQKNSVMLINHLNASPANKASIIKNKILGFMLLTQAVATEEVSVVRALIDNGLAPLLKTDSDAVTSLKLQAKVISTSTKMSDYLEQAVEQHSKGKQKVLQFVAK